jgi:hypothetical protein
MKSSATSQRRGGKPIKSGVEEAGKCVKEKCSENVRVRALDIKQRELRAVPRTILFNTETAYLVPPLLLPLLLG